MMSFLQTDTVESKLNEHKSDTLMNPVVLQSVNQWMYVLTNHLKQFLRKFWVEHVNKAVEKMPTPTPSDYKLPPPTKQEFKQAFQIISDDKDMIMKSFDVCGITTTDPSEVRSGEFYSKCMEKAIIILDSDFTEDDPFTL